MAWILLGFSGCSIVGTRLASGLLVLLQYTQLSHYDTSRLFSILYTTMPQERKRYTSLNLILHCTLYSHQWTLFARESMPCLSSLARRIQTIFELILKVEHTLSQLDTTSVFTRYTLRVLCVSM